MSGHGWVTPNPDGSRVRCGGPGICPRCSIELTAAAQQPSPPLSMPPAPEVLRLVRWAAAALLVDSYMSLVYYRGGIKDWDTAATPSRDEWASAMTKARKAADEMCQVLKDIGVDEHAVAREMDRYPQAVPS